MKQFLKHLYCSIFHRASFTMMDGGCCVRCKKCNYSEAVVFILFAVLFLALSSATWINAEEGNIPDIMRIAVSLESAVDAHGPWSAETNTFMFVTIDEPQKFYRVRLEAERIIR